MADRIWAGGEQCTVPQLFARRLETDPDGEYLDLGGVKLTAGDVMAAADRFGGVLHQLGTDAHDRVASLVENSSPALLTWAGTVCAGRIAVPINTAYKGAYLTHQLTDSGSRVVVVAELVGATGGVGYELLQQQQIFDMAGAIAWTLVLVIFVLIVQGVITLIENHALRYRAVAERAL